MKVTLVTGLLLMLASPAGPALAQDAAPVAGTDYIEIPNGQPLEPAEDGVVVVEEFFNYICPACNAFEPHFVAWQAELPAYVEVVHVPAAFRADFVQYARAYYAAVALGVAEQSHADVYEAIHRTHRLPAEGEQPDEERIAEFYTQYGVDADEFLSAMRSFGVEAKVRRATQHMQDSKVRGTPSIVVDGRYLVRARSYGQLLSTASYLIEQAQAE